MSAIPLVVVERIWRVPEQPTQIAAELRAGGHPMRVVLDFSMRDQIINYVEMPSLLDWHPPSAHAVVALLDRFERGEAIALPADLSDEIRRAPGPRSPFDPLPAAELAALEAAADRADVVLVSSARDGGRVVVALLVEGRPLRVVADVHDVDGTVPWFSIVEGPRFDEFSAAVWDAISRLIYRANRGQLDRG